MSLYYAMVNNPNQLCKVFGTVLALAALGPISWCSEMPREIAGKWCTTKALRTSNVRALTKGEQADIVGRVIHFFTSEFRSGTQRLAPPRYEVKRFQVGELVDRFMIMPGEIGLSAPSVREVDVNDQSGHGAGIPGDTVLINRIPRTPVNIRPQRGR
jgi:hypothetical protein